MGILLLVSAIFAGFPPGEVRGSDRELLNRLAGAYQSRMNTALYVFEVGEPRPEDPAQDPIVFTGVVKLPRKEGTSLKGTLSIAANGDYSLVSRIQTIRTRKTSAKYFGNIVFRDIDENIGLDGTYSGRLRATATTRGQRREKLSFRVKLTQIVEEGGEPPRVYLLLGQFRGTK